MSLNLAVREACLARHHQHRLGAVLLRGGKPFASGHNFAHVHAEVAALNRAWRSRTDGASILVVRLRRSGVLGMAKPCATCMARLVKAGIRKVIYTNEWGELETVRLPRG